MLKFLDRVKFMFGKAGKKAIKITSIEELEVLIGKEREKLSELKQTNLELRAELKFHANDLAALTDSVNRLTNRTRSFKEQMLKANEEGNKELAERMLENIKEGKRLIDETTVKLKAKQECTEAFEKYVTASERALSLQERKLDNLNSKLSELHVKDQISKSFNKFSNLDFGMDNDQAIEELTKNVEIDYNMTEIKLDDLENELNSKDATEAFLESEDEQSLEDFINSL